MCLKMVCSLLWSLSATSSLRLPFVVLGQIGIQICSRMNFRIFCLARNLIRRIISPSCGPVVEFLSIVVFMTFRVAKVLVYHPLTPVLDHSADYTNYGNSLPQPCLPPSNLSATAWGKNRSKVPSRESDHAQPCPTLWFFKSKADGPVWKEEGSLAAEDWTPKGYMYCRTQKKKNNNNNNSDFCSR